MDKKKQRRKKTYKVLGLTYFMFDLGQCHYWHHEAIPWPYRGCIGSPTSPRWHVTISRFAVSPSTVSWAWVRFQETGSYFRRTGQGPKRSFTLQQDLRNRVNTARATQNDLQQAIGMNVSDQTIRIRLNEGGLRARRLHAGSVLGWPDILFLRPKNVSGRNFKIPPGICPTRASNTPTSNFHCISMSFTN